MDQGVLQKIKKVYKRQMLNELLQDDGERGVVELLKSINIKKVIYMIAESWNRVAESTLRKSWKNLWPANCDFSDNNLESEGGISENERESSTPEDFLNMLKKIDGCSDVDISDVNNWLDTENNQGCPSLTDDEIIALCRTEENEDDTDENTIINDDKPRVISHHEATSHLEQLMVYFERQVETTPNELLMLKRMRDRAAHKRYSTKLSQQKITDFIITK